MIWQYIAVEIDLFSKGYIAQKPKTTHRRSLPAVTGNIDKLSFWVTIFCAKEIIIFTRGGHLT